MTPFAKRMALMMAGLVAAASLTTTPAMAMVDEPTESGKAIPNADQASGLRADLDLIHAKTGGRFNYSEILGDPNSDAPVLFKTNIKDTKGNPLVIEVYNSDCFAVTYRGRLGDHAHVDENGQLIAIKDRTFKKEGFYNASETFITVMLLADKAGMHGPAPVRCKGDQFDL